MQDHVVNNLTAIKQRYRVPAVLASFHTARINGYVIEGHVPVLAIEKLLKQRPKRGWYRRARHASGFSGDGVALKA